jgi:hypothetical protein
MFLPMTPYYPKRPNRFAGKSTRQETFGQVRGQCCWFWLYCRSCMRAQPCAVTPFLILWGADAPVTRLLHRTRCIECGWVGGDLQWPGWQDSQTGMAHWPTHPSLVPVGTR